MRFVLAGYGSRGDVEPCAAVGRELSRRGHAVSMATSPDKVDFVESAGLAAVAYGPDTREQMNTATKVVLQVQNPLSALPDVVERVNRMWTEKSATLSSLAGEADLLVAGMNEQRLAANVAESQGIPLAALHFFPAQISELGWLQSNITKQAEHAQRSALGLPEAAPPRCAPLEIQAYEELCVPGLAAQWGESAGLRPFVGAVTLGLAANTDDEVAGWIADGAPPIYFGFGSTPVVPFADTVAMIEAACAELGERALICAGPNDFADVSHGDDTKIVAMVNHTAVFPACRAVVHHGGAGTTAAGLRAGVPTLVLWLWLDQPVWAAAVEQLGVGSARPFAATTRESLVADLRTVLDPAIAARAHEVAAHVTPPAKSVAAAADLLEEAAGAGRPD
ncbi:glycosyltransferase [Mycobacterium parmense]|uniref:Putative glycosyltransferase n=1 Tax=Mycobacterium parmense TaxID=185642 RepID=A0A7I7YQJ8_9MYCO|nr:glycosyltransferase [Mycobacterium parmense]MCV7349426.1 glycosyltransferase [Mycobacterium parmense]ORW51160.1 glycosyltransferase [Mycobacterium parmense]BBZ43949.1 putative glycosyltransferase [Mycobacterium parmense]